MSPRVRCKSVENPAEANSSTKTKSIPKPFFVVKPRSNHNSVPIQYEIVEVNPATEVNLTVNKKRNKNRRRIRKSESKLACDIIDENLGSENVVKQISELSSEEARETFRKCLPNNWTNIKPILLRKLYQVVSGSKENYFKFKSTTRNNKKLQTVHSSVLEFNIYMNLVEFNFQMSSIIKRMGKDGGEEINRRSKLTEDIFEQQDSNNACSNVIVNVPTKKNTKTQRSDNTRLMLLPETKEDTNEKDLGEYPEGLYRNYTPNNS